jgi:hypothetical protein
MKVYSKEETKQWLDEQGLDPERTRKMLELMVKMYHDNFMLVGKMLPVEDRINRHLDLNTAELLLSIVSRACFFFPFVVQFVT